MSDDIDANEVVLVRKDEINLLLNRLHELDEDLDNAITVIGLAVAEDESHGAYRAHHAIKHVRETARLKTALWRERALKIEALRKTNG